jgi:hypothetical protein
MVFGLLATPCAAGSWLACRGATLQVGIFRFGCE